jgi:hypothetical protein
MTAFSASFQCDDCGKTYPGRKQETDPKADESLCRDCYEEPEEDEDEDHGSKIVTSKKNRGSNGKGRQDGWDKENDPRFGNHG